MHRVRLHPNLPRRKTGALLIATRAGFISGTLHAGGRMGTVVGVAEMHHVSKEQKACVCTVSDLAGALLPKAVRLTFDRSRSSSNQPYLQLAGILDRVAGLRRPWMGVASSASIDAGTSDPGE